MADELGETLMKGLFKNFPWVRTITFACEIEIMDEKRALETMPRMLANAATGLERVEFWTMGHSISLDLDLRVLKVRHHGDRVTYGFMRGDEGKWVLDDENSHMRSAYTESPRSSVRDALDAHWMMRRVRTYCC